MFRYSRGERIFSSRTPELTARPRSPAGAVRAGCRSPGGAESEGPSGPLGRERCNGRQTGAPPSGGRPASHGGGERAVHVLRQSGEERPHGDAGPGDTGTRDTAEGGEGGAGSVARRPGSKQVIRPCSGRTDVGGGRIGRALTLAGGPTPRAALVSCWGLARRWRKGPLEGAGVRSGRGAGLPQLGFPRTLCPYFLQEGPSLADPPLRWSPRMEWPGGLCAPGRGRGLSSAPPGWSGLGRLGLRGA